MKRILRSLILSLAALRCLACTCGERPVCERLGNDAIVFVGTALGDASGGWLASVADWYYEKPKRYVEFTVETHYAGLSDSARRVFVNPGRFTSCGIEFLKGERYLVFATRDAAGNLQTFACSGSHPVREAKQELAYMQDWKRGRTLPTLQGWLGPDSSFSSDEERDRAAKQTTLGTVRAVGSGGSYTARVDQNGEFRIQPILPGHYVVTAYVPKMRPREREVAVDVPQRSCATALFGMGFDGVVSGVARFPDGKPAAGVPLELDKNTDEYFDELEARTGADGSFEFRRVPVGLYRLGVNMTDEPTPKVPYRRTFFPASSTPEQARFLSVGEAQTISGLRLTIPAKLAPREIAVQALWPDGSPAADVSIWCAASGYSPWQHLLTDSNGKIAFGVLDQFEYVIGSAVPSDYPAPSRRGLSAKPVRVPRGASQSVTLRLDQKNVAIFPYLPVW